MAKKDKDLISYIGQFGILTVRQLSILCQRKEQNVRRRVRPLSNDGIIGLRKRTFKPKLGAPENLLSLEIEGWRIILGEKYASELCKPDKWMENNIIEHELLLNWVLIHLIHLEREIKALAVDYLTQNLAIQKSLQGQRIEIKESMHINNPDQDVIEFIPDAVFTIKNSALKKSLLFFLEVDMGTEILASPKSSPGDIRQKIINYQTLFHTAHYKRYEKIFNTRFNGFRLLFVTHTPNRMKILSRLVQEMPPRDFVWLTDQAQIFAQGLSAEIWVRGGNKATPLQSILGSLACDTPLNIKLP